MYDTLLVRTVSTEGVGGSRLILPDTAGRHSKTVRPVQHITSMHRTTTKKSAPAALVSTPFTATPLRPPHPPKVDPQLQKYVPTSMKHLAVISGCGEGDATSAASADEPATSATVVAAADAAANPALKSPALVVVVVHGSLSVPPSDTPALRLDGRCLREALVLLLLCVTCLLLVLLLPNRVRSGAAIGIARFGAARRMLSFPLEGGALDKNASERAARDTAIAHRERLRCIMVKAAVQGGNKRSQHKKHV